MSDPLSSAPPSSVSSVSSPLDPEDPSSSASSGYHTASRDPGTTVIPPSDTLENINQEEEINLEDDGEEEVRWIALLCCT